eukprot:COSAG02_NODE_32392_length_517_cov_0.624402_2_plen_50_part_01
MTVSKFVIMMNRQTQIVALDRPSCHFRILSTLYPLPSTLYPLPSIEILYR